jgi:hypothetical protein
MSHNRPQQPPILVRKVEVVGIEVYANDVVVLRRGHAGKGGGGTREEIKELSGASLSRLAFIVGNTEVEFRGLLTLTYPREFSNDGRRIKRDLRCLLVRLRRRYAGIEVIWFLEFQRRGAPHYHILTSQEPDRDGQLWVSQAWYEVVDSNDPRHLRAGTNWEKIRKAKGALRYVAMYAHKPTQRVVPKKYRNVGRFWGRSSGVTVPEPVRLDIGVATLRYLLELGGWEYASAARECRVLYNAAPYLAEGVAVDNAPQNVIQSQSERGTTRRK